MIVKKKKLTAALFAGGVSLLLIIGAARALSGEEWVVSNSSFAAVSEADAGLPSDWDVAPGSPWRRTDTDAYRGDASIRYSTDVRTAAGPVTQAVSLRPDTDYLLSCAIKRHRSLKPVVRLRYPGPDGGELVRILGDGAREIWDAYVYEFNSGEGGEAVLELWADVLHLQRGSATPAGTIGIDDVRIIPADRAAELRAETPETVSHVNLALGRRYTLNPIPGYTHTRDPGDLRYLTDGQYTQGYFWTERSTVGWIRVPDAAITIDLGGHYPVRGISLNTAGGTAGVHMPSTIKILVSVDGRVFHEVGNLVEFSEKRNPAPSYGGDYFVHRFYTDELRVHGRYVRLEVELGGTTFFTDEIEIYRGEDEWKELQLTGEPVIIPREHFGDDMFEINLRRRLENDLEAVRAELTSRDLPAGLLSRLEEKIKGLDGAILSLPAVENASLFKAIFPLNDVHAAIYSVLGEVREGAGHPPVVAWSANPWDYLTPIDMPENYGTAEISFAAMKGEERARALNFTNCTGNPLTILLSFDGFPGGGAPGFMTVYEAAWTDTRENIAIAAALLEVPIQRGEYRISLPAGMTRQVWFSFKAEAVPPGEHRGRLTVGGVPGHTLQIPVNLRVFDVEFPENPRLSVGGWDYTNTHLYGVTPQNRDELIAHLQERFVDSPWATRGVMPFGKFDSNGRYVEKPATAHFDAWVDRWPAARRYQVFLYVDRYDDIEGTKIGEPLFERKVAAWINFWADHAISRGIPPERIFLLLVDESSMIEKDLLIIGWSRAIKAAQPEVIIWDDGTRPAELFTPELMEAVDFLCPHRPSILPGGRAADTVDFYIKHREAGGRLDLYSCRGPARIHDPYTYYRLQAWSCFQLGAEGTQFWAFAGSGGINPWNEYLPMGAPFAPFFMDRESVTPGKHMEAIRESVADYEYLSMLREAITDMEGKNPSHRLLPEARKLAGEAVERVLGSPGAFELMWVDDKDRSVADSVLFEVGVMLEKLK